MTTPGTKLYSDADKAEIRHRWMAGESSGTIAKALGRTRNSVMGQCRRLGLKRGSATKSFDGAAAARKNAKRRAFVGLPPAAIATTFVIKSEKLPDFEPLPIIDPVPFPAGFMACSAPAWPDNLTKAEVRQLALSDRLYACGDPVKDGSAYCAAHHARFWRKPQARPEQRPRFRRAA